MNIARVVATPTPAVTPIETVSHANDFPPGGEGPACSHAYLLPVFLDLLHARLPNRARLLEIGAGNGSIADRVRRIGFRVTAIEPSPQAVKIARRSHPALDIREGSIYDGFERDAESYDGVYSLEVVEHLYFPRRLAENAHAVLKPNGVLILSTPFHGYWKNLLLAATGRFDDHFTALWDHGHIKFWSEKTLGILFEEAGFDGIEIRHAGRFPPFSKSMVVCGRKSSR